MQYDHRPPRKSAPVSPTFRATPNVNPVPKTAYPRGKAETNLTSMSTNHGKQDYRREDCNVHPGNLPLTPNR